RSYTTAKKLKVVSYAEAHGNRAASHEFDNKAESNIRLWRRQKERLQVLPMMKMAERGKSAAYPELEAKLVEWIGECRQQGGGVSIVEVRMKALTIAKTCANTAGFKASYGWGDRFMNHHGLLVRRRTTIAQKLPMYSDTKLLQFQKFIKNLRKQHCYNLSLIGNADQTPLNFDNPYDRTLELKGAKTVSIATTGHEKSRFTVMLACMVDGTKLPPHIVFKRKTMPRNIIFPFMCRLTERSCLLILCSSARQCQRMLYSRTPFTMDAFWCHCMPSIKKRRQQDKTDLAIIPGGMTKMLQPLDVTVNKPMKDALRRKCERTFTAAGGRMRIPTLQDVTLWIADVWLELYPAMIRKGFLKCSISNAVDGSEDDALWMDPSDDESADCELPVCEDDN
uniref:HTH CENPB-type domain-containing protein n=1 Tax=Pelodiscus sinensis TaxID=13735 RepID=K7FMC7_PELSI